MVGNCLDYLAWRGDLSLAQAPFCPVDALALSALAYVHFGSLVPPGPDPVPLGRTALRYLSLPDSPNPFFVKSIWICAVCLLITIPPPATAF